MSTILFTNITVADSNSNYNGKKLNIVFNNGSIASIGTENFSADQTIDAEGYCISPGWIDALAFCGEPGEEWKESIASLSAAAQAGGFTRVASYCGVHPVSDNGAAVSSIFEKGKNLPTRILPIGTLTKDAAGKEMAELFDMQSQGAVAFFDGDHSITQNGIKSRILEYANNFNAPVFLYPFDRSLAIGGSMHEGAASTRLGLKGIPSISEVSALKADLELASWLKTPLRVVRISSAESVELVRKAKAAGQEVYAMVPVMNLLYTDAALHEFDENYKVLPPLRTQADKDALIAGLLDGTIDAVCSNHVPQDTESKDVEFDYSAYGASTVQTVLPMLVEALGNNITPEILEKALSSGPARFLGFEIAKITEGSQGDFTIFGLNQEWEFSKSANLSRSANHPLLGKMLKGNILGTISQGQFYPANQKTAGSI